MAPKFQKKDKTDIDTTVKTKTVPDKTTKTVPDKTIKTVPDKTVTVPVTVVTEPVSVASEIEDGDVDYTTVMTNLMQIEKLVRQTMPLIKRIQKKHEKDVKNAVKAKKVKRVRDPDAPPSGFARPGPVSEALRTFLDMKDDELIARTQVAKRVSEYIKAGNMKNPDNNKEIIVDKKLATLFKVPEKTKIAFFQIQSYLTSHFIKVVKA
jgi:chromatin remodeling complex protein RSC6